MRMAQSIQNSLGFSGKREPRRPRGSRTPRKSLTANPGNVDPSSPCRHSATGLERSWTDVRVTRQPNADDTIPSHSACRLMKFVVCFGRLETLR